MSELPEPLTPSDCDLRGYEFMPLFGDVLFASATWIAAKPEAKVAALRLWWHSYAKEKPAASLPDDDTLLSDYAGYGVAVQQWRKVKAAALRGWIKCSDGRLYHKTVAEIALESWSGRKEAKKENARKQKEREDRSRMFAELAERGITPSWNIKTRDLRDLHQEHVTASGHEKSVTSGVTGDVTVTARQDSDRTETVTPPTPSKGDVTRKPKSDEAIRFIAEMRKVLSPAGNQRTKPKPCEKLLPALIDRHGFDPLLAAARAFYGSPEAQKDGGQFQCGLQVALGDGRIEALIKPASPIDWPLRMKLWRESDGEEWPERWGPKPGEAGFQGPSDDLFTQGAAP